MAGGGAESAVSSRETKFGEKKLNNAIIICDLAIDGNGLHPWVWEREREEEMGWRMGWAGDEIGMGLRKGLGMGWDRHWEENRDDKHPSFCFSPSQPHEDPTG